MDEEKVTLWKQRMTSFITLLKKLQREKNEITHIALAEREEFQELYVQKLELKA